MVTILGALVAILAVVLVSMLLALFPALLVWLVAPIVIGHELPVSFVQIWLGLWLVVFLLKIATKGLITVNVNKDERRR